MKIEINNLSKIYNGHAIFDHFSLSNTEDVQIVTLIGPSGGGKSTLLRILGGLESFKGNISIDGYQLANDCCERTSWLDYTSFLFQAYNLFPHLTALENITLPLEKILKFSHHDAKEKALSLAQHFKLEKIVHQYPNQMSGGQQQRIAICRAIAMSKKYLFLDEPTSALDPEMSYEVLSMLEQLKEEKQRIFLVTHHMKFAHRVSDRIIFISSDLKKIGRPDEILNPNNNEPELASFLNYVL